MSDVIVKSTDSADTLKQKAETAVGGQVSITERGQDRVVHLNQDQARRLNRMSLEDRRSAFGGDVRQILND